MPKTHPIQTSFAAGEISHDLWGRVDTDVYKNGVFRSMNMIPNPRGPIERKVGSELRDRIAGTQDCQIVTFLYSREHVFVVAILVNKIRIIPIPFGFPELLANGDFSSGLSSWRVKDFSDADTFVNSSGANLQAGVRNPRAYAQVYQYFIIPPGTPEMLTLSVHGLLGGVIALDLTVGTMREDGSLYSASLTGQQKVHVATFNRGVSNRLCITISQKAYNTLPDVPEAERTSVIRSASVGYDSAARTAIEKPATFTEGNLHEIQATMHPSGLRMYFTHKFHVPTQLVYVPTSESWVYGNVPFTGAPVEWKSENYPRTVAIHQGRSWWGGTVNEPTGIWASKSGSYDDLTPGGSDSDGISFSTPRHGTIMWIEAARELLVGTELDEFAILPRVASDYVLSTNNIKIVRQSSNGASYVKPSMMHTSMAFINANRDKLRSMWYSWTEDGWQSTEISFSSNHLLNPRVVNMTLIHEPNTYVVAVLEDGTMAICSYYQDGEKDPIVGWSLHNVPGASIMSATRVPLPDRDELWIAVKREVGNAVEIQVESISLAAKSPYYVDSYIRKKYSVATSIVTGLEHLEGREVQPVVDNTVHRLLTVVSGSITLDIPGFTIIVGLTSECYLETLPLVTLAQGESTSGHMKRWVKAMIRIWNSSKPLINGIRPPERFPATRMDTPELNRTELLDVANLGRSVDAALFIEMDLPRALKIINISGELGAHAL